MRQTRLAGVDWGSYQPAVRLNEVGAGDDDVRLFIPGDALAVNRRQQQDQVQRRYQQHVQPALLNQ